MSLVKKRKNSIVDSLFQDESPSHSETKKKKKNPQQQQQHNSNGSTNDSSMSSVTTPTGAALQQRKAELAPIRKALPVYQFQSEIVELLKKQDVLLIIAETGSGKSTQIPAYLDELGGPHFYPSKKHKQQQQTKKKFAQSICVTQPRRVAAMTVAKRVAEERGCALGTAVGYKVRFDNTTTSSTRIVYATDGMLLRESLTDPLLSRYAIVILDEAHERSLQTDILFGVVRRAMRARNTTPNASLLEPHQQNQQQNGNVSQHTNLTTKDEQFQQRMRQRAKEIQLPPLKVVVMSATLEIETFSNFFPQAEQIHIPGRLFPVQAVYTKETQDDYIDAALATALQIHQEAPEEGDILIFLPGQEEIMDLAALLKRHLQQEQQSLEQTLFHNTGLTTNGKDIVQNLKGMGTNISDKAGTIINGVMICVLYAALPPQAQMLAFAPKPPGCTRKIILATNIAETSVTLDGIRYVVDCGKHKTRDFNDITGMESLTVQEISKAQAAQRMGRSGRVSEGVCFRLYTEDAFHALAKSSVPEILRVNLAQVVLMLKGMGVHDPSNFDYLTPPSQQSMKRACELLYALEALDNQLELTEYGKKMALLPVDPIYAHLLLQSVEYGCTDEMLTAVSMLSTENVLYRPGGSGGDADSEVPGGGGGLAAKAAVAHRRFSSHEGDIPTLLNVYKSWRKEAMYVAAGGKKTQKKLLQQQQQKGGKVLLHGEWCTRNFVSGRALVRAHDVRSQLSIILERPKEKKGLGVNVHTSCKDDMEIFLKCVCAGLFLQSASRVPNVNSKERGSGDVMSSSRGRYKTKVGNTEVSIHPTSTMFGRNPAPKCVVYTELLVTKKTYIRGVTQVREEWLAEVAPKFFDA